MIPLTIGEIAATVDGTVMTISVVGDTLVVDPAGAGSVTERTLTSITADTRTLVDDAPAASSTAFVALRTETADGHRFLPDAFASGAAAVIVDAAAVTQGLRAPTGGGAHTVAAVVVDDTWAALRTLAARVRAIVDPRAVGITGSVGKTTVKDLSAALLSGELRCHASPASFNNELGVPLTLLGMPSDCEVVVCEIGARAPGDVAKLATVVEPDVAVVTAVAPAHLGPFGSIEAIARAKAELVEALDDGVAVLNVDDHRVAAMASRAPSVIGASLSGGQADIVARRVRMRPDGRAEVVVATPWGDVDSLLPIPGRHQVMNAMLAIGVAGTLGIGVETMARRLAQAEISRWRGQVLALAGQVTVIDDAYNANPASVAAALDTLRVIGADRRTIAVLGEMAELGASADDAHRSIGQACRDRGVDVVVAVGSGASGIAEGARDAGHEQVVAVADTAGATAWLDEHVAPGDVVLVKASRVVGLERVVAHLRTRSTSSAEADAGGVAPEGPPR